MKKMILTIFFLSSSALAADNARILKAFSEGQTRKAQNLWRQTFKPITRLKVPVDKSRKHLQKARTLYGQNRLTHSIRYYDKVSKSSFHWLEAAEEKAWAYLLKGDTEKTLAITKSVLAPIFKNEVGPEPFYLEGIAHFRSCNYLRSLRVIKKFKKRFKRRIAELEGLQEMSYDSPTFQKVLDKVIKLDSTVSSLKVDSISLPRHALRDLIFSVAVKNYSLAIREMLLAQEVLEGESTSFIFSRERLARKNVGKNYRKAIQRLKVLAGRELNEFDSVIKKLHLLEVEAIQRMHIYNKKMAKNKNKFKSVDHKNTLHFPVNDEIWVDEIDSYQVKAKNCPTMSNDRHKIGQNSKGQKL